MFRLFLIIILLCRMPALAQHCPWDCSGMILVHTGIQKERMEKLNLVLVDQDKQLIIDTVYGTGKDSFTNDPCRFLFFEDFQVYRKQRIAIHPWYAFDTVYHFGSGMLLVKYNYCKYRDRKLYIRYVDPYVRSLRYHYIEIPEGKRIHLHNYNNELRASDSAGIRKKIEPLVFDLSCPDFGLDVNDCK